MAWAERRKSIYLLIFILVLIILPALFIYKVSYKAPTCFDGVQNQNEEGIDCGGSCTLLCRASFVDPVILWSRAVKINSNGTYNILIYAQNQNIGVGANNADYSFKVYDREGILLYTGSGKANIPPANTFVIFQDGINIGDKVPVRIEFSFAGNYKWEKLDNPELNISTISKEISGEETKPRLIAVLKNNSLSRISNIESIAILYDENDNAVAFSKTLTDFIEKDSTANIVFTWPEPFSSKILKIEIISRVLPK